MPPAMVQPSFLTGVAVVAFCLAPVSAQVAKGGSAPSFKIEKAWNDGPTSFEDLQGKVVILDFAQTW
jgi:hypothetical protein